MKAQIIQIGNSQGIRIPKTLLKSCGLENNAIVDISANDGELVIKPSEEARAGWSEAFAKMAAAGDDTLLNISQVNNQWDDEEWEW